MRTLSQIPTLTISTLAANQTMSPPFAAPPTVWSPQPSSTPGRRLPVAPRAGYAAAVRTAYDEAIERLRVAAHPDRAAPPELKPYLEQVQNNAYRIVDADVAALLAAGFSEDEIFEQTVSVAVAAGLSRLEAALQVLR
jgi:hypothetical protein